jgi:putative transposase
MAHSHSNIWTHIVLWTKGHQRLIKPEMVPYIRMAMEYFHLEFPEQQIHHSVLQDHIHLLIKLPERMSVDQLVEHMQLLICENLEREGFLPCLEWDSSYHAHSVSLNRLSSEKSLLERQEYKHKEISLVEELKFLGL